MMGEKMGNDLPFDVVVSGDVPGGRAFLMAPQEDGSMLIVFVGIDCVVMVGPLNFDVDNDGNIQTIKYTLEMKKV
jgi:hypothetical protein